MAGLSRALPLEQPNLDHRNQNSQLVNIPTFATKDYYNTRSQKAQNSVTKSPDAKPPKDHNTINIQELIQGVQQNDGSSANIVSFGTYDLRQDDRDAGSQGAYGQHEIGGVEKKGHYRTYSQPTGSHLPHNSIQLDSMNHMQVSILDQNLVNKGVFDDPNEEEEVEVAGQMDRKKGSAVLPSKSILAQFVTGVPGKSAQGTRKEPATTTRARWTNATAPVASPPVQTG